MERSRKRFRLSVFFLVSVFSALVKIVLRIRTENRPFFLSESILTTKFIPFIPNQLVKNSQILLHL